MKTRLTLLLLAGFMTGNNLAQTNVILQMDQRLGEVPFTYGITSVAELGYYFNISRLQYYVSEITLIHDNGLQTLVTDLHLLIDPAKDSIFPIGNYDITDLEQIEFWIGVDSAHNHLDPALYPANHPLALHDPSMHWGWAGGYRFIAFEGFAGYTPGFVSNNFQIHTIGEENYRKISLKVEEIISGDSLIIPIQADYSKLLHRVDIAGGWESHSTIGKSKQISLNTKHVFTTDIISSSAQLYSETHMFIAPNPAEDFLTITLPWPTEKVLTLVMTNMQGNTVLKEKILGKTKTFDLQSDLTPGVYVLILSDSRQVLATEKIIVIR